MKIYPSEKIIGILSRRFQYDRPSKGFVFDTEKLAFTTIENFEGKDIPEKWVGDDCKLEITKI